MKPLLYLNLRLLANAVKLTLRTPKRLIPAILITLWFAIALLPSLLFTGAAPPLPRELLPPEFAERVWAAAFALGVLISIFALYRAFSESLIVFGAADIDFTFPTPIPRATVMSLKLLRIYVKIALYSSVFIYFVIGPFREVAHGGLGFLPAAWLGAVLYGAFLVNVCTTVNLITNARDGGRWWLAYVVRWAAYGIVLYAAAGAAGIYLRTNDWAASLVGVVTQPVFVALMTPARWAADVVASPFIGATETFGLEFAALAALAALSCALVLARKENPYEPSLAVSARSAAVRSALRSGDWSRARVEALKRKAKVARPRFGIPPFGRGAWAVVWKNLVELTRGSARQLYFVLVVVAVVGFGMSRSLPHEITPVMAETFVVGGLLYMLLLMSTVLAHSFRAHLKQVNILKPIPIPAWQVVAAEAAPVVAFYTVFAWAVIGITAVIVGVSQRSLLPLAVVAFPFVALGAVSWQAVIAVMYPNYDDVGQRFIGGLLSFLCVMLSLGLPCGPGAVLWMLGAGTIITAAGVIVTASVVALAGFAAGGLLYARHDPTSE